MGMNLTGKDPKAKRGESFDRNCWGWRPLWEFVCDVAESSPLVRRAGHFNDGAGFFEDECLRVAAKLGELDAAGKIDAFEDAERVRLALLPSISCRLCGGTGKRTDVEVRNGCNKCLGAGKVRPDECSYVFNAQAVRDFAAFLAVCGGFEIW
jgi:hypothetical protein